MVHHFSHKSSLLSEILLLRKMEVESESEGFDKVHGEVPPKPPDGGGVQDKASKRVSFRDKLLGAQEPLPRKEKVDLVSNKLFRVELEGGDRLKPKCFLEE